MKKSTTRRIVAFTAALMLVFSAAAIGASDRPFKGKGTSVVAGDPFAEEGAPFTTTGTGTHLGNFTGAGTLFFSLQEDGMILGEGMQTLTAANGDTLDTEFSGLLDPETGAATVEFIITGGTGRFEDATGEFTADVQTVNQAPPTFTFTVNGNISY
jgi:hypothetical protein